MLCTATRSPRLSVSFIVFLFLVGPAIGTTFFATSCMAESLQEKLEAKRNSGGSKTDPQTKKIMTDSTAALEASGITAHAPKVGEKLPDAKFISAVGAKTSLIEVLKGKPAIVTFYRGGWCPYCNLQLHEYQQHLSEIGELGAQLIAISPELPDNALSTKTKNELEFVVLSDSNNAYARGLGIVFELNEDLRQVYQKFGIDLQKANGSNGWELPLAATFVIDGSMVVRYAFVNADYTKRAEPTELLNALRDMR